MSKRVALVLATILSAGMIAGCSSDAGPPYDVTTTMVSGSTTPDIWVYAPDSGGPWPVVFALPGSGGSAQRDLDVLATELARQGLAVFAADMYKLPQDAECAYRFVRTSAEEYGGDLSQPVTMVGYSTGASVTLVHGLGEDSYGPDSNLDIGCPPGAPRPDVLVSLNGCHVTVTEVDSRVRFWDNTDAHIVLVASGQDTVCAPWNSEQAATTLREAGYDVTLVEIPDANHWAAVFHDLAFGTYSTLPVDDPSGQEAVETILAAIDEATP